MSDYAIVDGHIALGSGADVVWLDLRDGAIARRSTGTLPVSNVVSLLDGVAVARNDRGRLRVEFLGSDGALRWANTIDGARFSSGGSRSLVVLNGALFAMGRDDRGIAALELDDAGRVVSRVALPSREVVVHRADGADRLFVCLSDEGDEAGVFEAVLGERAQVAKSGASKRKSAPSIAERACSMLRLCDARAFHLAFDGDLGVVSTWDGWAERSEILCFERQPLGVSPPSPSAERFRVEAGRNRALAPRGGLLAMLVRAEGGPAVALLSLEDRRERWRTSAIARDEAGLFGACSGVVQCIAGHVIATVGGNNGREHVILSLDDGAELGRAKASSHTTLVELDAPSSERALLALDYDAVSRVEIAAAS